MSKEIIIAIVAAFASTVASAIALILGVKNVRIAKEKLDSEKSLLEIQAEHLRSQMAKLVAETERLQAESNDKRRHELEREKVELEIEKQRAQSLLEKRDNIYAEILSLVYRLRNKMRESLQSIENSLYLSGSHLQTMQESSKAAKSPFGDELYLLTENLYKYRAFIDEDTFDLLHRFKRLLQDAKVQLDYCDRPPEKRIEDLHDIQSIYVPHVLSRLSESVGKIRDIYSEADELHSKIISSLKAHIEAVVKK